MGTKIVINVHVRAVALPDGGFTPHITVVQEKDRHWRTVPFEMEEKRICATEKEAISVGKKLAMETLQVRFPDAQFRMTPP